MNYKIAMNTLGFEPDLGICTEIEDVFDLLKKEYPAEDNWTHYMGGRHIKMYRPRPMPSIIYSLLGRDPCYTLKIESLED